MFGIEISIVKQGSDVQKIEDILLEQFQKYERVEVQTIERPLQARVGNSYTVLRYRVYTARIYEDVRDVFDRLRHHTKSDIMVTLPRSVHIFKVDRAERLL